MKNIEDQNIIVDLINGDQFLRSEKVGCYLCGKVYEPRSIPVAFGMRAMVAECPDCRLAFQTPRPPLEASLAYMDWRWASDDDYVGSREGQMQRARQQVNIVNRYFGRPIKLLDFGAGSGAFVRSALDAGWDATGVERCAPARSRAKEYYDVDLIEEPGGGPSDAITLWDVIEHLRDPVEFLKMIREHLVEDGLIFIETGNFENWVGIANENTWGLYLFDHQFYFTPSSLGEVLRRAGFNGFRLLDYNRFHPPNDPIKIIRDPFLSIRHWSAWANAMVKWPNHGDINIMVAVGKRESGL